MQNQSKQPKRKPLTLSSKRFAKRDEGFICKNCGMRVLPLLSSSRDHCTYCLYSLHVDINPGDRMNECGGLLVPIGIERNAKKGFVIKYHCDTCRDYHNCKAAPDDNMDEITSLLYAPINRRF